MSELRVLIKNMLSFERKQKMIFVLYYGKWKSPRGLSGSSQVLLA